MADLRRIIDPGKFEGELFVGVALYMLAGDGDDGVVGGEDGGDSYTLLLGPFSDVKAMDYGDSPSPLNNPERDFLGKLAGVILQERSDGFVSCEYYTDRKMLDRHWASIEADFATTEDDDESDD